MSGSSAIEPILAAFEGRLQVLQAATRSRLDGAAALLLEAKPLESVGGRIVRR
jgi:hypothetical protein